MYSEVGKDRRAASVGEQLMSYLLRFHQTASHRRVIAELDMVKGTRKAREGLGTNRCGML